MNRVFADAQYWVAILNEKDQSHPGALAASRALRGVTLVTTEEALTEVLAYFSERGPYLRRVATAFVEDELDDPQIVVHPQSHQTFQDGFALYRSRPDKIYSLIDCVSMLTMSRSGILAILTHDANFSQEGFTILL